MQTPITNKEFAHDDIYTRKSTEEGLDQEYNSLEAQRDAGLSFVNSQRHEGWLALDDTYDDGGFSGGNIDRPGLKRLMQDIEAKRIDVVVVYKIDRLTRSLAVCARRATHDPSLHQEKKWSDVSVLRAVLGKAALSWCNARRENQEPGGSACGRN